MKRQVENKSINKNHMGRQAQILLSQFLSQFIEWCQNERCLHILTLNPAIQPVLTGWNNCTWP